MRARSDLLTIIGGELAELRTVSEQMASERSEGQWSRKQELGHLLDSATNNHVRFTRAALEGSFSGPQYDQNGWVRLHGYDGFPWADLVEFWYRYNSLLAHLVGQIPEERMNSECAIGSGAPATLGFVIEDYMLHMQHHLDHILRRETVTAYPREAAVRSL